jgi:hypothetical protein
MKNIRSSTFFSEKNDGFFLIKSLIGIDDKMLSGTMKPKKMECQTT